MSVSVGPGRLSFRRKGGRHQTKATPTMRTRIFDRDGHRCLRCDSPYNLTVDHIQSVVKGGTNDDSNLQTLCESCNTRKGDHCISYLPPEAA